MTKQDRPNILWISTHDTSAWNYGCYGDACSRTPNIDRLAAKGVPYTNAFTAGPICSPSRTSIYTGMHHDQNGLKFDQDRSFGSVNLRRAFNQVRVLDENRFWEVGVVGLDVKAVRTQPAKLVTKHLGNSIRAFLKLVGLVRSLDKTKLDELIAARDYEELDWLILSHLMGR